MTRYRHDTRTHLSTGPKSGPGTGGADLHIHTTASDGTWQPQALVKTAVELGLSAIAVTDHDTLAGVQATIDAAAGTPLRVIPGIELSTWSEATGEEVHLLGYGLAPDAPEINRALAVMREARRRRARRIVEKLRAFGIDLAWEQVMVYAGEGSIGRPHIARALLAAGYVTSMKEAFDRYLGDHGVAFVPREKLDVVRAIDLIHRSGGVAVLAHPGLLVKGSPDQTGLLHALQEAGLDGIEVFHTKHSPRQAARFLQLAERHSLLVTGGSDCHGPGPAQQELLGFVRLADMYVDALLARIAAYAPRA